MSSPEASLWKRASTHVADRGRIGLAIAALILAGGAFVTTTLAGRALLLSNHMWPPDILFGCDIARNIHDISEPGHNARSNVHPLFPHLAKPLSYLIQSAGVTRGMSAIILTSAAGAAGLLLTILYLRLRGASRIDSWLAAFLMAGTSTYIVHSAIPGTYIYSLCFIAIGHILLFGQLRHPDERLSPAARWGREALWTATGVINYGLTVTNGFMSFLTYGFGRRGRSGWSRAIVYGAVVLGVGLLLSWLLSSSLNLWAERRWLTDDPERGPDMERPLLHSASSFLVWGFVAPIVDLGRTMDDRAWVIATFHHWRYPPLGWILAGAWVVFLGMAVRAAWRDREPISRRLTAALCACLTFQILLHTFYYVNHEGVFVHSAHSLFLVIGFLAPMLKGVQDWTPPAKWTARALIFAAAALLAARHSEMLVGLRDIVPLPEGY